MTNTDWRINLVEGSTFIYKGNYCTITKIRKYHFEYEIQNSDVKGYMDYDFYITIPSYQSKQRYIKK